MNLIAKDRIVKRILSEMDMTSDVVRGLLCECPSGTCRRTMSYPGEVNILLRKLYEKYGMRPSITHPDCADAKEYFPVLIFANDIFEVRR